MKDIKLFLTDVDGCLTDGGMYYSKDGDCMKRFCVYDGMGMVLLQQAGIRCGILTSEVTDIVAKRAEKLHLDYLRMGVGGKGQGRQTKLQACREICEEMGITLAQVCYVGDDVNDLDLLQVVGLPVCPPNAMEQVKSLPSIMVLEHKGGDGAIREICERLLQGYGR